MITNQPPNVLVVGRGEYVTGLLRDGSVSRDKGHGVVTLVLADLRRRGLIGKRIGICGTTGAGWGVTREHLASNIGRYKGLSTEFETFPSDSSGSNPEEYLAAMDRYNPGDIVAIYTSDTTHFKVANEAVKRGMHVLIAKPAFSLLDQHIELAEKARRANVLACIENHKRYDPVYADFKARVDELGDFSFFSAYMSQPDCQAKHYHRVNSKATDVSLYLNSHHIDYHCWLMGSKAIPIRVTAHASTGILANSYGIQTPDTITVVVQWQNTMNSVIGCASYTASWIAQTSDAFTQQRWFYLGSNGEASADQARRGYNIVVDERLKSPNPLYLNVLPSHAGEFSGQAGYGYQIFEHFVTAVGSIREGVNVAEDYIDILPTLGSTTAVTAILGAAKKSLLLNGAPIRIHHSGANPTALEAES